MWIDQDNAEVRPRHEGGGIFAPARGGGSGANRAAARPGKKNYTSGDLR